MDNSTICYNAIQRHYRNALVDFIRHNFIQKYGPSAVSELKKLFSKKDTQTGMTLWDKIRMVATERRSGGTGEVDVPIQDDFDLLGVEFFYNVFEKFFDILCPEYAATPNRAKSQAKTTLLGWMRTIKNFRDPLSHPTTADFNFEDSANVLYCARKVLDFCKLKEPAAQILELERKLLGGIHFIEDQIAASLPPEDEVVTHFVGRQRELLELSRWFGNAHAKRWALSGEGGKGKSAIAYSFARSLASRADTGLDAVLWISAKRRRFIEGQIIDENSPDFHDLNTSIQSIIRAYGFSSEISGEPQSDKRLCIQLLTDNPALLIVDDIDALENEAEDAIPFLLMDLPNITQSRVLVTSRRALFGMRGSTTQITGFSATDGEAFIRSRCDLMGLTASAVLRLKDKVLQATDSSPLFIEDLLRLTQAGLDIEQAIGLWSERRGEKARRYAMQREYEKLSADARHLLLALSHQDYCTIDHLTRALNWDIERILPALEQLKLMFLVPSPKQKEDDRKLALNQNTKKLVRDIFSGKDSYRRVQRQMQAAMGQLSTKRKEEQRVSQTLRKARLLANQCRPEEAEQLLRNLLIEYPGRADIHANLGWICKKQDRVTDARDEFKRAHELQCRDKDAYWHWSDLEAKHEEWTSSEQVADFGLNIFPGDQGLLFRKGYALHRRAKEEYHQGSEEKGEKLCKRSISILEESLKARNGEERNSSIFAQIYRSLVLTAEILKDGDCVKKYLADWNHQCPNDYNYRTEYDRLRPKFPDYLPPLGNSLN
jgi:tetratricopeptide (TPR) repeat protein